MAHLFFGLALLASRLPLVPLGPLLTAAAAPGASNVAAASRAGSSDDQKRPVPEKASQQEATTLVRDVFEEAFRQAESPADKSKLARRMIGVAADTDDVVYRFVLLRIARDVAATIGDVDTLLDAVARIDRIYRVDVLDMKAAALVTANGAPLPPAEKRKVAEALLLLVAEYVVEDRFAESDRLLQAALAAARKARDSELTKRIVTHTKEWEFLKDQFEPARDALALLEQSPTDARGNRIVGQYLCLWKEDWRRGLPYLALGDDATLKRLAVSELAEPTGMAARVSLGDGWWSAAEKETDVLQRRLRSRAGYWYRQALFDLKGLARVKVERRLAELPAAESGLIALVAPDPPSPPPASVSPWETADGSPRGAVAEQKLDHPSSARPIPRGGPLVLLYRCGDGNAGDNQIKPLLKISNTGPRAVALSELTIRYWFSSDNPKPQRCWCDYAQVGNGNVTTSFRRLPRPVPGADGFLEIGFLNAAPALAPGSDTGEIQIRFAKEDWSNYDETNDYSFNAGQTNFAAWPRVTLYHKGALIWGTEPR